MAMHPAQARTVSYDGFAQSTCTDTIAKKQKARSRTLSMLNDMEKRRSEQPENLLNLANIAPSSDDEDENACMPVLWKFYSINEDETLRRMATFS